MEYEYKSEVRATKGFNHQVPLLQETTRYLAKQYYLTN